MLCVFGVFLALFAVFISLLFSLFPTVHRKTHFLVNLQRDNNDSDYDYESLNATDPSTPPSNHWL